LDLQGTSFTKEQKEKLKKTTNEQQRSARNTHFNNLFSTQKLGEIHVGTTILGIGPI